jgi:hypothetical protein
MNEANPNPPMTALATATLTEMRVRAGSLNSNVGTAHAASHMSAAMRKTSTRGGTFNSRTCMASAPRHNLKKIDEVSRINERPGSTKSNLYLNKSTTQSLY